MAHAIDKFGTTSACAENTLTGDDHASEAWNYLRVRGEYRYPWGLAGLPRELPPRARRIQSLFDLLKSGSGTTSACAENTDCGTRGVACVGNYLRVRGEYSPSRGRSSPVQELPPRARRIPSGLRRICRTQGTTSACAENTQGAHSRRK